MTRPGSILALLLFALPFGANGDEATLRAELDAIRDEAGVAGFGLVLVGIEDEPIVLSGGIAARGSDAPITGASYVRVGSITKTFTGLAMLAAARAGLVDLAAPIAPDRAPDLFVNRWHPEAPVTLGRLLEHTAGLRDLGRPEWDHNEPVSLATALAVAPDSRRLAWPPGRHSVYSNAGAGVAARVFELETGRDFEQWMREVVFEPLGMDSATLERTPEVDADLIGGYDRDGRTPIPYWHQLYRPFGSMNVRLREMARLLEMLLGQGKGAGPPAFSDAEIDRLETPGTTLAARAGLCFGYGFGNYAWGREGHLWRGHGGDADGYLSHYGYNRAAGKGYFLVINAFQPATLRRMRRVIELALTDGVAEPMTPVASFHDSELARYAGRYREAATRFGNAGADAEVVLSEGGLRLVRGRHTDRLLPVSGGFFRRAHEPVATTAFIEAGGAIYLQGPFGNYERITAPGDRAATE